MLVVSRSPCTWSMALAALPKQVHFTPEVVGVYACAHMCLKGMQEGGAMLDNSLCLNGQSSELTGSLPHSSSLQLAQVARASKGWIVQARCNQ